MQFFLDTVNLDEIKKAEETGLLDGVTTNPTLVAKEGCNNYIRRLNDICKIINGPVSAQITETEFEKMVQQARIYQAIANNIVVKTPMTELGMKVLRELKRYNILVNVTLVFAPNQALICAKLGADYISPFVGRIDDQGADGMRPVQQIRKIFDNYGFKTKILVASVRNTSHVRRAALIGADIATMPYVVFKKLFDHPLTERGVKTFREDCEKLKNPQL